LFAGRSLFFRCIFSGASGIGRAIALGYANGPFGDLGFSSPDTSRIRFRIFVSGWFAGTRASGEMYENSRP
jgi:hypothetical protein